jgi:hypothetical protein
MSEMIERVAKAIEDHCWKYEVRVPLNSCGIARAAIAAMRKPTERMLDAGATGSGEDTTDCALGAWAEMIDEALYE